MMNIARQERVTPVIPVLIYLHSRDGGRTVNNFVRLLNSDAVTNFESLPENAKQAITGVETLLRQSYLDGIDYKNFIIHHEANNLTLPGYFDV
jgi:hypothetical protein